MFKTTIGKSRIQVVGHDHKIRFHCIKIILNTNYEAVGSNFFVVGHLKDIHTHYEVIKSSTTTSYY